MKEKLLALFEKISPYINKISENKILQGVSTGMMATLPMTVVGSFSLLLCVVPLGPVSDLINNSGLSVILNNVFQYTMGLLAIYMVFFITKNLVHLYLPEDDGTAAAAAGILSFLALTPMGELKEGEGILGIPTTWLGSQGAFAALFVSIISALIYVWFKKHGYTIKMPQGVPPMVANVFVSITPFVAIAVLFIIISYVFSLTDAGTFHQAIYSLLQMPMQKLGGNIWTVMFLSFLMQLIWFFGLHGQNILSPFYMPIWLALDLQNLTAFQAGQEMPNIVGNAFYQVFCFGGLQLGLIYLLMRSKSKRFREVGKLSFVPAIFGIGEPLNFGLPLVLNFKFLFPFLTNGVFMLGLSYLAIASGLVPRLNGSAVVFGLPIGVTAFLQGGWRVVVLQIVTQVILPTFLWYPWFKFAEKEVLKEEKELG
jgi:PTS system cellobiose-specific IIC component